MGDFRLSGGCQCGAVRYTINAPARSLVHCHCGMCRKVHGAIFASFSDIPADKFTIDQGEDNLVSYESSPGNPRKFCKTCGGHILTINGEFPEVVYLSTGTLDGGAHPGHPEGTESHIFVGSKAPWYEIHDELPQTEEY
jgi:hypothetical protein